MNKWKCMNSECGENCIVESKRFHPANCPMFSKNFHLQADWREVTEPVTKNNQLPKLTAEVFDRPGCPEWAKYAAVDSDGDANYFESYPMLSLYGPWWSRSIQLGKCKDIAQVFDSTKWQNSLIERPAKKPELPDWCKVGEWVYLSNAKYYKIIKICDDGLELSDGVFLRKWDIHAEAVSARLRPYNAEEMRGLVGKVIERHKSAYLIISYAHDESDPSILIEGKYLFADNIMRDFTIDGKPCGVLEHMENGEWEE